MKLFDEHAPQILRFCRGCSLCAGGAALSHAGDMRSMQNESTLEVAR